jgi:hypothetical protein
VHTLTRNIVVLVFAVAFFGPAARSEHSQKPQHPGQEERISKLEERADTAEKAATVAAMEKEYIERTQKLYESYYQKTFNIQLWTLGIVGLLLVALFGLVAKFSLNLFEQRTKLAAADATAQMRNEYARILAKEVQKLWDSNAADTKKLKEAFTGEIAVLEKNLKDLAEFQIHFVQGLARTAEEPFDDGVSTFRQALMAYKSSKPGHLMETRVGATAVKHIFELLRKKHGENFKEEVEKELADPLYNGLEEELALTALQIPLLTPLINQRVPSRPEPPAPEIVGDPRPAEPVSRVLPGELDESLGEEFDSCRLISS